MAEKDYSPIFKNTHNPGYQVIFVCRRNEWFGGCLKPSCWPVNRHRAKMNPCFPNPHQKWASPSPSTYKCMVPGIMRYCRSFINTVKSDWKKQLDIVAVIFAISVCEHTLSWYLRMGRESGHNNSMKNCKFGATNHSEDFLKYSSS